MSLVECDEEEKEKGKRFKKILIPNKFNRLVKHNAENCKTNKPHKFLLSCHSCKNIR